MGPNYPISGNLKIPDKLDALVLALYAGNCPGHVIEGHLDGPVRGRGGGGRVVCSKVRWHDVGNGIANLAKKKPPWPAGASTGHEGGGAPAVQ